MIPDQWYPLFESKRLRGRPVGVRRLGLDLVLWRDPGGRALVMEDRCPHRGVKLSLGKVAGGELECGYHGFRFDAAGACTAIPCEGAEAKIPRAMCVRRFPAREAYGLLWLFFSERAVREDTLPAIPWIEEFGEPRAGDASGTLDWPINYVRTVESNFDIHHTPFLHKLIAPGVGKQVEPYQVEVEGTRIRTRGELRHEGAAKGIPFRVEFEAPSVTFLELAGIQFVVADCPVDDENTWRFARYRSVGFRVPGLRWLYTWLFLQVDFRIAQLRQDLPMMASQRPRQPDQGLDRLVAPDAGTAAYLKLRRRLLAEAAGVQPAPLRDAG